MNNKDIKDRWIMDMIRKRYVLVHEDGTIMRARSATRDGVVDFAKGYREVMVQTHKTTGRVYANFTWRGVTKSVLINRMVALAHLPNPEGHPQVNHKDGDKAHNAKSNLEWASNSENEKHAHRTGLKSGRGSANANVKLGAAQVLEIRASADPAPVLAARYGVSRSTIVSILSRRTWSHL